MFSVGFFSTLLKTTAAAAVEATLLLSAYSIELLEYRTF
jgi:hypothetical protein